MLRALFHEIVLIDNDMALAEAEAADLSDANALARPAQIWAGSYGDAASARIAVITAGAATHGAETRMALASRSAVIVTGCVAELVAAGFEGIILVAANPVDLMALLAFRRAGLQAARVIGTGTLLDTSRLQQTLAKRLNVAPESVEGFVLGEHGDTAVAAFSTVRIGGLTSQHFVAPEREPDRDEVSKDVREAAYRIIAGKGYTSFGVATAIVRICEAILRDERVVLPVSALFTGQFGIHDCYLSLPCIIGHGGVERILLPDLTDQEGAALRMSAAALREAHETLQRNGDTILTRKASSLV
jgi:L-lactate dehydrogenase